MIWLLLIGVVSAFFAIRADEVPTQFFYALPFFVAMASVPYGGNPW